MNLGGAVDALKIQNQNVLVVLAIFPLGVARLHAHAVDQVIAVRFNKNPFVRLDFFEIKRSQLGLGAGMKMNLGLLDQEKIAFLRIKFDRIENDRENLADPVTDVDEIRLPLERLKADLDLKRIGIPRATISEMGTFYFNEIKPNKRILIETHSDHLIDRVRMEARDAEGEYRENHKHVLILYFERVHGATKIHPIRISETGDLIDVPDGYRDFFMTEQIRFLGF